MKTTWLAPLIILAVIVIGGLIYLHHVQPAKETSAEPIKIGAAIGFTGDGSGWSEGEQQSFELAIDEVNQSGGINGRKIDLIQEDTKSSQEGTVSAVLKLITADHIVALLGPTWGDSFQGAYPILEKYQIPSVAGSVAIEALKDKSQFSYLFSTWWPEKPQSDALVTYLSQHKLQKIAIINDVDIFDQTFSTQFLNSASDAGLQVVSHQEVPVGTTDFRTVITKIKSTNPQAIFIELEDTSAVGPFYTQLKQLGSSAVVLSTIDMENPDNLKKFPGAFDDVIYPYPHVTETDSYKAFAAEFQKKYGKLPSGPSVINAYNAALALIEALKEGPLTGPGVKADLQSLSTKGVGIDTLKFDTNGQIEGVQFEMKTIKNNQFVTL